MSLINASAYRPLSASKTENHRRPRHDMSFAVNLFSLANAALFLGKKLGFGARISMVK